jgi:hypothetical protein
VLLNCGLAALAFGVISNIDQLFGWNGVDR